MTRRYLPESVSGVKYIIPLFYLTRDWQSGSMVRDPTTIRHSATFAATKLTLPRHLQNIKRRAML